MKPGQLGVIPGSMGTRSYIVSGLGNPESYHSAPHGAGRRMSRNKARQTFTMQDLETAMQGVAARLRPQLIHEIPGAYKDIDEVMENSRELLKIEHN
jgi:tRNA-splicing ligase RtcB